MKTKDIVFGGIIIAVASSISLLELTGKVSLVRYDNLSYADCLTSSDKTENIGICKKEVNSPGDACVETTLFERADCYKGISDKKDNGVF